MAKVVREYTEPDSYIRFNGKKCLIVSLEMLPGHNIVKYGRDVHNAIDTFRSQVPTDVRVGIISDMPDFVSTSVYNFLRDFGLAIFSVLLVTILLLPKKVALIAATAIPITISIAIGIMWMTGMSLQTVSLAALTIVLGIAVDDAIIIIDNYIEKLDNNYTPYEAASKSVTELFVSVFTATSIIILCFMPMSFLMTGLGGDFIKSFPITIAYALIISLIVSETLIPLMNYLYIKRGIKDDKKGKNGIFLLQIQSFYEKILIFAFKKKKLIVLMGAISFLIGLLILMLTPQQLFPTFQRNQFAVEVYLPEGSSLHATDIIMKKIEKLLLKDKRVKEVASFVGTSSPRFNTLYSPNFPSKNYGQFIVITKSIEATKEILDEYSKDYSNFIPNAYIKWKQLEMMPAKAPIEVRISGADIPKIKEVAIKVQNICNSIKGSQWVRTDWGQPLHSVALKIKQDEASRLGYSRSIMAYSLMTGTMGLHLSTIWEGDYSLNVNLIVDKKIKTNIDDIINQYVTSPFVMYSAQVKSLADAEPEWTEGEIVRRNGVRTITVLDDLNRGYYSSVILNKLRPKIDKIELPSGVNINYGGEYELGKEEFTPMFYSLLVGIGIMFIILLAEFKRIKTVLLMMTTLPLSFFGAAFGVSICGYPFGVTAFVGLIGLIGIIVRNGIIYISYAEELQKKQGYTPEEAAMSAAKRRMRPIFLTSSAAAVGVIPMILSRSPLWGPLGAVVCFGLIFGLVLSLLLLPILYYLFHKNELKKIEEVNTI